MHRNKPESAGRRACLRGLIAAPLIATAPRFLHAQAPLRVLHVMSYHRGWAWTESQLDAFRAELNGLPVEFRVLELDAKQRSAPGAVAAAASRARDEIDRWKPDLLYVTDDAAVEHVVKHYVGSDLPIVFSGVNGQPQDLGVAGTSNISGVLEVEHSAETLRLLRDIQPSVRRLALVVDESPMWGRVVERVNRSIEQVGGFELVEVARFNRFADYQRKLAEWQGQVDAIGLFGIFTFADSSGSRLPFSEVLRYTEANSQLPDFSFWRSRVRHGTLCAVSVSPEAQGRRAGEIARQILADGISPSEIPTAPTRHGQPLISLRRAKALGITVDAGLLLASEVHTDYAWEG